LNEKRKSFSYMKCIVLKSFKIELVQNTEPAIRIFAEGVLCPEIKSMNYASYSKQKGL